MSKEEKVKEIHSNIITVSVIHNQYIPAPEQEDDNDE